VDVRAALAAGRARLRAAAHDATTATPDLDAEVLLRHVLGATRAGLFTYPERGLEPDEHATYRALVERRAAGEPVAYLTGHQEFMGIDFVVDRRVLIPRAATETLVERALRLGPPAGAARRAVDVGTGSGAIALSLAWHWPQATVVATDASAAALRVATCNRARLHAIRPGLTAHFVRCDLVSGLRGQFDLIGANLPYITRDALPHLPLAVRGFEPRIALDGGPDGLDVYRALLADAPRVLRPGGLLLMECDPGQAAQLLDLALAQLPGGRGAVVPDLSGHARVVEVAR
jgi:release factor glutamine methyltransferase